MKKISIIVALLLAVVAFSCNGVRKDPGTVYMPDMAYSRAYETYTSHDNLKEKDINYNATPVAGTMKRGELHPFPIAKDEAGETKNYEASANVKNPIEVLSPEQTKEAERLYLVNCGICHGAKLDGNGPLFKRSDGTDGPYQAQPANLATNETYTNMAEGKMMYSVTYGKGQMGSYASQLNTTQRWMIIKYIKEKQAGK